MSNFVGTLDCLWAFTVGVTDLEGEVSDKVGQTWNRYFVRAKLTRTPQEIAVLDFWMHLGMAFTGLSNETILYWSRNDLEEAKKMGDIELYNHWMIRGGSM